MLILMKAIKAQNDQRNMFILLFILTLTILYIAMTLMKRKTKRIGKNDLRIIGNQKLFFKGKYIVSFAPLPKNKRRTNTKILPTFNNDRKHYTCAFHLPSDPPEDDEYMRKEHKKQVLQSMIEVSQILVPKPKSIHKYCGVCRDHYEDYKEHTDGEIHLSNLKKSEYQFMINQMCADFKKLMMKKKARGVKGSRTNY